MGDSSASYIRVVQHLIEKCLLFNMTREECMEALSKHADIKPVITSTVWKELEKENREFFEAYWENRDKRMWERARLETTILNMAAAARASYAGEQDDQSSSTDGNI